MLERLAAIVNGNEGEDLSKRNVEACYSNRRQASYIAGFEST